MIHIFVTRVAFDHFDACIDCEHFTFDFNLSRCSFCGLCSEVCPTKPIKALIMSEDYELGSYSRETQILRVDQMYDGVPIEQYSR